MILVRATQNTNTKKLFSPFYAFSWQVGPVSSRAAHG